MYAERIVRLGDTSPAAMRAKALHVLGAMQSRRSAWGVGRDAATAAQVYTIHDLHPFLADEIVPRGAADGGLTCFFARPPVQGLEFEMDVRAVALERVI